MYTFRFLPFLKILVDIAPLFADWLEEDIRVMLKESNEMMPARVQKVRKEHEAGVNPQFPSIFSDLLNFSLPEHEKTDLRIGGEGCAMIGAGTETTAVSFFL
jgi:hypothetical protein